MTAPAKVALVTDAASRAGTGFAAARRLAEAGASVVLTDIGIRINSVHPGMIMTDIQAVAFRDNPAEAEAVQAALPIGRVGEPHEVATIIAFLALEEASYVTGSEFVVEGAFTAQ